MSAKGADPCLKTSVQKSALQQSKVVMVFYTTSHFYIFYLYSHRRHRQDPILSINTQYPLSSPPFIAYI